MDTSQFKTRNQNAAMTVVFRIGEASLALRTSTVMTR
jgi:hypothetical protein